MAKVLKLLPVPTSPDADQHARADTQRNQRLFDWADAVLKGLRLDKAVAAARSTEELRKRHVQCGWCRGNLGDPRCAASRQWSPPGTFLRPQGGRPQAHSQNRFAELKKTREAALRRKKQPDWTDQLILDKDGKIIANLANLILILREAPKWKGVLVTTNSTRGLLSESARHGEKKRATRPGPIITSCWREFGSNMRMHQSIGWRCWASSTGSGSTQPVPPSARLFRLARLGWSASTGSVACHLFPCRGQRVRSRNWTSVSDFIGRSHLSAGLQGRSRARSRRSAG